MRVDAIPRPFVFEAGSTALVIIDLQVDFMECGGWADAAGLGIERLAPVTPIIATLLDSFRNAGSPVIFTREGYRPDLADLPATKLSRSIPRIGDKGPRGRYMITGEPCNDIIQDLRPRAGEIVLDKPGAGAFYATLLDHILRLRGISHLVFTGVTTDVCVHASIREANDRGYECLLIEDATASYDDISTQSIIKILRGGVACSCASARQVLAAMDSGAPPRL